VTAEINGKMLKRLDRVASETLGALHREAISDRSEVLAILQRAAERSSVLLAGIDRRNNSRRATIVRIAPDALILSVTNIGERDPSQLFFNFEVGKVSFFFACSVLSRPADSTLRVSVPSCIYRAERRDIGRAPSREHRRVAIERGSTSEPLVAEVSDEARHGLGIRLPALVASVLPHEIALRSESSGKLLYGRIRHRTPDTEKVGWTRIGLSVSSVPTNELISVERRTQILDRRRTLAEALNFARARMSELIRHAGVSPQRAHEVRVVRYPNDRGESLCAIENGWGEPTNGTAVIIPPAWGRTKETLLPLAMTLVETFRALREPIRVIRFDGTNRRGESYIDPECRGSGDEYLHFTFSQAARDISATASYLQADPTRVPGKIILVTFSLASVEARHALATDNRISGWVSIVGMADLQAALRTISGGIDYGNGLLQGMRFGRHELVGVVADMDHTGLDAIKNDIGFLEDVRRDMSRIEIPITWIHGRYDAWMDLNRVVESMSCGRTDNRRIIEVPTGHQLRSGEKALATFQLVAEEVSEMALGRRKPGVLPQLSRVAAARAAELARLPKAQADVRGFWADYLLGRSRILGMELLAATAAYRNFMEAQVGMLRLAEGQRVADLGSGTGEFSLGLRRGFAPTGLKVFELDFVRDALLRASSRRQPEGDKVEVANCQCVGDLDLQRGEGIPFASSSLDSVLASLIISYVASPERFLREIHRTLKPGGRVVVSSMVRDADAMMLFHDGLVEYATTEARGSLGKAVDGSFEELVRDFLNDGSRLLDLEERGRFRFWEESELRFAVSNAGFVDIESRHGFGEPPQAIIVAARRPLNVGS
jgi:SAM-dependent methyltransferase/pimeloyl-ACP methyl ester carboxylesterase